MEDILQATVVEYIKIYHEEDARVGNLGLDVSFKFHPLTGEPNIPIYKKGDIAEIKPIKNVFCCADMEDAFRTSLIGFGKNPVEVYRNKMAEVVLRTKNQVVALPYCLWCISPIMTVDMTEGKQRNVSI